MAEHNAYETPQSAVSDVEDLLVLIDVLFIFRTDRRCVHDFIAGTKVVRVAGS